MQSYGFHSGASHWSVSYSYSSHTVLARLILLVPSSLLCVLMSHAVHYCLLTTVKYLSFIYIDECLNAWMNVCVLCVCLVFEEPEEAIIFLGTGIIDGYEAACRQWETNFRFSAMQPMLLNTVISPSFFELFFFFLNLNCLMLNCASTSY